MRTILDMLARPVRLLLAIIAALVAGGLAGAVLLGGPAGAAGRGPPSVVATTTQAAALTRAVAAGRAEVHGVLAPNTDPHEYELRPSDVRALTGARLVVRSGGDVDAWLGDALAASGTRAPVLTLLDRVRPRRQAGGVDPHWWQDPRNAALAVAAIRGALVRADPAGAGAYRAAARRELARLRALDARVARCLASIPRRERLLVTTHDALGYYARRYGIRVLGAVIPSLSSAGQPSAGETARLIATIRRTGARAVFAESSVNPKVEAAIAAATGARAGDALWTDALGPAGSSGATYAGSILANTRALTAGFSGGAVRCP
jgi:ABC-type Zn uptake system ZnuABC Zn-binding protein ZnuA